MEQNTNNWLSIYTESNLFFFFDSLLQILKIVLIINSFFFSGVFHSPRFRSARPQITQRHPAICVRNLRQNFRTRSEPGTTQGRALSGIFTPQTTRCSLHPFLFLDSHLAVNPPSCQAWMRWLENVTKTGLCSRFRKEVSTAKYAVKVSSGRQLCRLTCLSTPTRGRTHASTAAKGSIRSRTWRNTPSSTQVSEERDETTFVVLIVL